VTEPAPARKRPPVQLDNAEIRSKAFEAAKRLRAMPDGVELLPEQREWLAQMLVSLANRVRIERPATRTATPRRKR
jgi:hypothetical protein